MPPLRIELANEQDLLAVDARRLCDTVRDVLTGEGIAAGEVSIAVVDDPTIRQLNAQYLTHDYATDALSFALEASDSRVVGQIVVSAEMALSRAAEFRWSATDELLLYVIHAALHLAGYDDARPADAEQMRQRERHYLQRQGVARSE